MQENKEMGAENNGSEDVGSPRTADDHVSCLQMILKFYCDFCRIAPHGYK